MTGTPPGDQVPIDPAAGGRRLAQPPSARYAAGGARVDAPGTNGAMRGPLKRALLAALLGAIAVVAVGGVFASAAGLLFVAGGTGASVGLVLARAAVPLDAARPVARGTVIRLAVALALASTALADVALWLFARQEGGTLGLVEYLSDVFGLFIPANALVAAATAWWGASAGPVQP